MSMDEKEKVGGVQSMIGVIFSSLRALRIFAPEYSWKGLGNVLGDYGECVAIAHYDLDKAPCWLRRARCDHEGRQNGSHKSQLRIIKHRIPGRPRSHAGDWRA